MSEFSDFTKLVLDRMETNPDEFEAGGRWDTLVRGLEARAIGQFDDRYARTLWPLEPLEIEAIMAKYRKLYLARIHKDMLRNIVSGNDKRTQFEYVYDSNSSTLSGRILGKNPSTMLTTSAIANQAQSALNIQSDKASVKGDGAQIGLAEYIKRRGGVE